MMFARLPRLPRRIARGAVHAGALAAALALAACSSPTSRFYTLGDVSTGASAAASSVRTSAAPAWLIEVAPIDVPPQVAKTQLVVQTGPTQVKVLEEERWASLPGDELRRALSTSLTQQLNTIDVYGTAYSDTTPVYRVSVNVQRFESWPGSHALIDAVWSVRAVRSTAVMTCRSVVSEQVGSGYDSLVDGHRRALQRVSEQVAGALRAMAASSAGTAGASVSQGKGVARVSVPGCPSDGAAVAGG
ncbi:PqiC family protein [Paraburkholderia kirstenboschensis]|uniref:PqiC family protein n=1 Tax=Paraburkholderia kirstenboschensis TaxID=1245436 RepID=A0ABZ0EQ07_9BURK|nr:PqiC family protein [Paraburkholderia kirstenboschensis]WOD18437.1 PqiC family protein [Paraburkholderia kirstenboschensis]